MSFTLSISNLTDTSASIVMTLTSDYSTSQSVSMSVQEGGSSGSTVYSTTVTIPDGATTGDKIRTTISSLTASTTYYVATTISGGVIVEDLTFTTRDAGYDAVPKVATQGQWEDLADRVQSKAEIGSVLSTPSNVEYVGTNNIVDGAVTIDKLASSVISLIYPVGSIYMSATLSTVAQVEAALGGTWIAWGAGRVPVGVDTSQSEFDTVEETGGEKTHTLTIAEMPSHHHQLIPQNDSSGTSTGHTTYYGKHKTARQNTLDTGGGGAHNNLQPYITCYMYKKVSDSNNSSS